MISQSHENLKHSIAGAGAGIVSSIVTCPLDVAKTRLQNQGIAKPGEKLYKGTVGTLSRIWQEEGIRGLYRGLGPTILGYLPTWAIYFTAYDYCKSHWADELGMLSYISYMRTCAILCVNCNLQDMTRNGYCILVLPCLRVLLRQCLQILCGSLKLD